MANLINQQYKSNTKGTANISLVLGIISIIPVVMVELIAKLVPLMWLSTIDISIIYFLIAPLIAVTGLIFGILGLKSTKRNFAIVGIVLSVIGLAVPLYYFLFQ